MADSEFEEFHRPIFEPHTIATFGAGAAANKKNNSHAFYSLIPNDDMEDSTSSKSDGDGSDQEDGIGGMGMAEREREPKLRQVEDDELGDGLKLKSGQQRSFLSLKCGYLMDEDSSPDSERLQSLGDVDSGHSTAHSPNDFKSMSPQITSPVSQSPFPPPFGGVPFGQLEMLEATHRGLHKFVPRHHDEIELEIGDAIYVQKEAEDLWCEGVNLRTGRQGIFPSAYAVDLDYNEFDPTVQLVKKERYLLGYLGSVETLAHKGTGVVCQAVRKIVGEYGASPTGQTCILEVSDQGLRMVDRSGPNVSTECRSNC
ncbi:GL25398 [Drosophila persimilis]|uniref:GL25398 n=1 Tax=Drosophila persimilis TaxID=7234 RepID=B4IR75_DROPE|nr:GL25398 [Drosophila persimilis]